ncbi:WbqC family protein [Domibacillus iocasae]|nr:WbqC family protein [Domibacillus iocasae]
MKVVINQSNYIPWKGYFDLIANADLFVFLDNVQYTKNDWRNRNKIITDKGLEWLTIPINNSITENINDKYFINDKWKVKHYKTILQHYRHAPFSEEYKFLLDYLYINNNHNNLSLYNIDSIKFISQKILGLKTDFFVFESDKKYDDPNDRLMDILLSVNATTYLTGPAAKNYLNEKIFEQNNIDIHYYEYGPYKKYLQKHPDFIDHVSILDTIFTCGPNTLDYIT